MSKFSNLYDVDGNIINKSPQHTFTIEETEKLVDDLTKKVQENPDNEVYKVYLNNAQRWLMHLYDGMSRQDLMKRMSFVQNAIQDAKDEATEVDQKSLEELNNILDEFKKQYDKPENTPTETQGTGESDMVGEVEQPVEVPETVMDEYVDFEEVNETD
jgi:hypothetical protein